MSKIARGKKDKIMLAVMIAVIIVLLPILAVNLTLIIKGSVNPDVPPDIFGVAPLAVTSGSMEGDSKDSFSKGSLIFIQILDEQMAASLEEGDIITFVSSDAYVTHRIVSVNKNQSGEVVSYVTKGDANNATDGAIPVENVIGKYLGGVANLGDVAMFMQTPTGVLVIVGVPVLIFIVYDIVKVWLYNRRLKNEAEAAAREQGGQNDKTA